MDINMDIAVLSDIHGNYIALESCVSYALDRNINTFIFLGDYIGELAYPQRTMELIYSMQQKYTCYFIKGNKEDYWLNYKRNGESGWRDKDSTTGALLYAYHHLTQRDMQFFETLEHTGRLTLEGLPALTICHGAPNKINGKLVPGSEATYEAMCNDSSAYILCGHTHRQMEIEHARKKVLNGGSVGVPLDSGGKAQFVILQGRENGWQHEFVSLSYDTEEVIAQLYESGLTESAPCWCRVTEQVLRGGKVSHSTVLTRAMALCEKERGSCEWPNIPEECWEQAVAELIAWKK